MFKCNCKKEIQALREDRGYHPALINTPEIQNWVSIARVKDPKGAFCHYCKGNNYSADDCGWYYADSLESKAICAKCWKNMGSPLLWGSR